MRNLIDLVSELNEYAEAGRTDTTKTSIKSHPNILSNPAFVKWFGNSKVKDTENNPLVCYHGTYGDFSEFEYKLSQGFNRLGYWFDVHPDTPGTFAGISSYYNAADSELGTIIPCFLKIENPFYLDSEVLWDEDRDAYMKLSSELRQADQDRQDKTLDRFARENADDLHFQLLKKRKELIHHMEKERSDSWMRIIKMLPNGVKSTTDEVAAFQQMLIGEGHDGIYMGNTTADWGGRDYKETDWWIAFHPNQIKSVFAKEFRDDSNNISEDG